MKNLILFTTLLTLLITGNTFAQNVEGQRLRINGNSTVLGEFKRVEGSSRDAVVKIRGSRNACTTCRIASLQLSTYDSNEGSGTDYLLGIIVGGMETVSGRNGYLRFDTNQGGLVTEKMRIKSNGNVGIGTTTPGNKLEVNGTIRTKEIIVEDDNWPDYVFYDDYNLPTLEEEEKHIEAKGHLLGFESEADMAGEIQLGDVSKRQQAKIEEMMLHLIEMKKEMIASKNEIVELKEEIVELKEENEQLKELIIKD